MNTAVLTGYRLDGPESPQALPSFHFAGRYQSCLRTFLMSIPTCSYWSSRNGSGRSTPTSDRALIKNVFFVKHDVDVVHRICGFFVVARAGRMVRNIPRLMVCERSLVGHLRQTTPITFRQRSSIFPARYVRWSVFLMTKGLPRENVVCVLS